MKLSAGSKAKTSTTIGHAESLGRKESKTPGEVFPSALVFVGRK